MSHYQDGLVNRVRLKKLKKQKKRARSELDARMQDLYRQLSNYVPTVNEMRRFQGLDPIE